MKWQHLYLKLHKGNTNPHTKAPTPCRRSAMICLRHTCTIALHHKVPISHFGVGALDINVKRCRALISLSLSHLVTGEGQLCVAATLLKSYIKSETKH